MAQGSKTGGRQKGTPNRVTAEIREYAQQYTVEALEGLAQIARTSKVMIILGRVSAVLTVCSKNSVTD